ncbi:SGNH/GDSL hydrolase family protein [Microbacterium enclense]|uniref:SGNH/GDSL hydrolase family protein n=1 Tax=Microbacterium enclense TaxID=993073 RepID=UPI003D75A6BB
MRRLFASGAVLAVLSAAVFAVAGSAASAVVPDLTGHSYVALGDSYAAGWGLPLTPTQPAPGCDQSDQNYPHLLAAEFGFALTDRTCGGAVIANVVDTPQNVGGTAPVQTDFLDATTDLVTLTIGGNDLGFWNIGQMCVALAPTGPVLGSLDGQTHQTCREQFIVDTPAGPVNTLETQIDEIVAPALSSALQTIRTRAPNAKIIGLAYPALAPDAAHTPASGCYTSLTQGFFGFRSTAFPYLDVDVALLRDTQAHMDDAMAAATTAAGAAYVSLLPGSLAHSPCSPSDAYVNGITLTLSSDSIPVSGLPLGGIKRGALHPNASGMAFARDAAADAVRALFAVPDPTPGAS